ncbi:MAG: TlpA family protein disulfide reductase [Candidatus Zhuqueibacterota bacterium]
MFLILIFCSSAKGQSVKPLLKAGDPIPAVELKANLTPEQKQYLGVKNAKKFRFGDIQASVVVVEYFNKYCPHCQKQAPIMNQLYQQILQDESLKSQVKMIGIGSGNNEKQVELFRQEKNIPFPLIPDDQFILHDEIGRPRTPFIILIKKSGTEQGIVGATFLGIVLTNDQLLEDIRKLVFTDVMVLDEQRAVTAADENAKGFPKLSDQEFRQIVVEKFQATHEKVMLFERILVLDEMFDIVYKIRTQSIHPQTKQVTERSFFIRKVYRNTVCGTCHDAHFWYTFDTSGKILNFYSIYLTKAYNRQWNESELSTFSQRIIGKSIVDRFEFNPITDAVTAATITSSLIFDTLAETKDLFAQLKKSGAVEYNH